MKCPNCGYDNKEGAKHCDLCKNVLIINKEANVLNQTEVFNSNFTGSQINFYALFVAPLAGTFIITVIFVVFYLMQMRGGGEGRAIDDMLLFLGIGPLFGYSYFLTLLFFLPAASVLEKYKFKKLTAISIMGVVSGIMVIVYSVAHFGLKGFGFSEYGIVFAGGFVIGVIDFLAYWFIKSKRRQEKQKKITKSTAALALIIAPLVGNVVAHLYSLIVILLKGHCQNAMAILSPLHIFNWALLVYYFRFFIIGLPLIYVLEKVKLYSLKGFLIGGFVFGCILGFFSYMPISNKSGNVICGVTTFLVYWYIVVRKPKNKSVPAETKNEGV